VIANIKDELKNMFYKNRNHVIKKTKIIKEITNDIFTLDTGNTISGKKPKKKNIKQ
jgi:hypothetical protein